ncbi:exostosin domain-containing protein [Azohydromonas australica]|uniref:exostosin domain-containing protein n=1 Tax=Azohydromonas australica TaxID=364039 RepID=UPI00146CD73A|nr:exostosin family protein [Azohydromonas australica]
MLRPDPLLQILCFPWATLVDLKHKGQHQRAQPLLEALHWAPPRITLRRATVMQHIWAKDMLEHLQALGVTDVYWSHAVREEPTWSGGIRVHPFPLYPVCCGPDIDPADTPPLEQRPYLYSFIGAYEPDLYLSKARQWIFELPSRPNAHTLRRHEWHYQGPVYREQIHGDTEPDEAKVARQLKEQEYRQILEKSIFSLCPSGSGPNSIRLWESLGLGAIPVILSDRLALPGEYSEWRAAAVFVRESRTGVEGIPKLLSELCNSSDAIDRLRVAGRAIWLKVRNPVCEYLRRDKYAIFSG